MNKFTIIICLSVFVFVNGESTDPCVTRNIQCKQGQVCRLMKVDCFTSPCSPQPTCVDGKEPTRASHCKINQPIIDANHKALYCGRGSHRGTCPDYTGCVIDPTDRFAVCCYTGPKDGKEPTRPSLCKINQPIIDANHKALFCGRGFHRVTCPDHTGCHIDPLDRFAVCCYTGPTGILG